MELEFGTFEGFPKITRYLNAHCIITEKVDGTNAAVAFEWDGTLTTQSRKRIITPEDDNYGFSAWAHANREQLFDFFGPGRHFGEWWGRGIQKRYGAFVDRKYFTPFNVGRFNGHDIHISKWPEGTCPLAVLAECDLKDLADTLSKVEQDGWSLMAPGATPEGVMIWSSAFGYIKHPFDDGHKWTRKEASP